MDYLLRTNFTC